MGSFNFYINVDQCLNMSNFDMFFYRLQKNRQFHLSNVQFYDDEGEYSLQNALQNIHSFMEEHPYDVENFKIILGMRQIYYEHREWKDSTLYKLLKLYYNLWDNKIFIQSKDTSRRNVSMVMLMDMDFSHRHTTVRGFSYSEDIALLIQTLGLEKLYHMLPQNSDLMPEAMEEWMLQQLKNLLNFVETGKIHLEMDEDAVSDHEKSEEISEIFNKAEKWLRNDPITRRFLLQYLENHVASLEKQDLYDYEEIAEYASTRTDFCDEFGSEEEESVKPQPKDQPVDQQEQDVLKRKDVLKQILWDFVISSMVDFAQSLTGHYNVFQKELDRNSRASRQLALLSVVEYITAEIRNQNYTGILDQHENLDEENRRNWEQANNTVQLRQRYGFMLRSYKEDLSTELQQLDNQIEAINVQTSLPEYEVPEPVRNSGQEAEREQDLDGYEGTIQDLLAEFKKKGRNAGVAQQIWEDTYFRIEDKINCMEDELEEYARVLTEGYKKQLDERRLRRQKNVDLCSQVVVEERIRQMEKEQQQILEELNAPNMSMSIKFQDQLNALQSLEKTNKEVEHYLECQNEIQVKTFSFFLILILSVIFFHMTFLQGLFMGTSENILEALGFMGLVFLALLSAWRAPMEYYYEKNMDSIANLEKDLDQFLTGYTQKQEQFDNYINLLNQLDSVNAYLEILERMKQISSVKSRKLLWHKVKIGEHLEKLAYFDQMIDEVAYDSGYKKNRKSYALDENEDVIHNSLYWPQGETEV